MAGHRQTLQQLHFTSRGVWYTRTASTHVSWKAAHGGWSHAELVVRKTCAGQTPGAALHQAQLSSMTSGRLCARCCVPSSVWWEQSAAMEFHCLWKMLSTYNRIAFLMKNLKLFTKDLEVSVSCLVWAFYWWELCCVSGRCIRWTLEKKRWICLVEMKTTGIKITQAKKNVIYLTSVCLPAVVVFKELN